MDTGLGCVSPPLEVDGAEIPQCRVAACGIVEAFDVIENLGVCQICPAIGFACDLPGLQRRKESLHGCVVPDVA
jgi:hypothetical protein